MDGFADISKFQTLINESNRSLVENGKKWEKAKRAIIPLLASGIMNLIPPNYMHPQTVLAPEKPAAEQNVFTSPEVQEAARDLYMRNIPLGKRGLLYFIESRFGKDYKNVLTKNDIQFLVESNEASIGRVKAAKEHEAQLQKRRMEEQEMEEIYSGKRPYPTVVDADFQRRILEYGKPIK